jgi:hypothetical protein
MYCGMCGKEFESWKITDNYKCNWQCKQCCDENPQYQNRFCRECGKPFPTKNITVINPKRKNPYTITYYSKPCEFCPPKDQWKITAWAKRLNQQFPSRIIKLKECSCDSKKINHHPDYDKPFEIEALCYSCHRFEHLKSKGEIR